MPRQVRWKERTADSQLPNKIKTSRSANQPFARVQQFSGSAQSFKGPHAFCGSDSQVFTDPNIYNLNIRIRTPALCQGSTISWIRQSIFYGSKYLSTFKIFRSANQLCPGLNNSWIQHSFLRIRHFRIRQSISYGSKYSSTFKIFRSADQLCPGLNNSWIQHSFLRIRQSRIQQSIFTDPNIYPHSKYSDPQISFIHAVQKLSCAVPFSRQLATCRETCLITFWWVNWSSFSDLKNAVPTISKCEQIQAFFVTLARVLVRYRALVSFLTKFLGQPFLHPPPDFSNTFPWIPGTYGTCQHLTIHVFPPCSPSSIRHSRMQDQLHGSLFYSAG